MPEYTWGEGNTTVSASRKCRHDSDHSEEETVAVSQMIIKQATCKEKGKTKYTSGAFENNAFAVQEKTLENIDALGHSISYVTPQMPTCEEHGLQGCWSCTRCQSMFSDSAGLVDITAPEVIPASGHQYDEGEITKAATCTLNGTRTFTCGGCGDTYTESVNSTGHDWNNGKVTKEATCEENGVKAFTCKNDSAHSKTEVIPASGHDLHEVLKVESTCTDSGTESHWECGNCSSLFSDADGAYEINQPVSIPPRGHSWSEPEYTWGESNTTVSASRICRHDSSHIEEETVQVSQTIIKQATCKEKGKTKYTSGMFENNAFAVQEKTLENIEAFGHSVNHVSPHMPTCEEYGQQGYWSCTRCQSMFSDSAGLVEITAPETIPATGHQYDEGEITTSATCLLNGTKTFTCSSCGNTYTESVHATGHDWNNGKVTKEATCEENGVRTYTCKNDVNHTRTEVIPATDHDYDEGEITKNPTCVSNGTKTFTCRNCGDIYGKSVPNTGHDWNIGNTTKQATCEESGVITFTCKNDITHVRTEMIPATGHEWDEWKVTKASTTSDEGEEARECKHDANHKEKRAIAKLQDEGQTSTDNNTTEPAEVDSITPSDNTINNAKVDKKLGISTKSVRTTAKTTKKQMIIKWKKVKNATNYRIAYRQPGKKWQYAWTKGKTKYYMKNLKNNGLYEFKLQAVRKDGSTWTKSKFGKVNYRYYAVVKAKVKAGKKDFTVTVKENKKASGYEVLYSLKKSMEPKTVKVFKSGKKTKLALKRLKAKKNYYVQTRPYKVYKGHKYIGVLSKKVKIRTK